MFNLYDDSVANFHAWRGRQTVRTPHGAGAWLGLGWLAFLFATIAAWVTHVIVCIKISAWILLAFGCLVAPVGVVHGFGVWAGLF